MSSIKLKSSPILLINFLILSSIGFYLLWIIGEQNNFVEHGSKNCLNGLVRNNYIGLPFIDEFVSSCLIHRDQVNTSSLTLLLLYQLCVLVNFFEAAGQVEFASPFLIEFGGLLAAMVMVIYIESYRASNSIFIRYSPLITGILFQIVGAGIIIPLWCGLFCILISSNSTSSNTMNQKEAKQINTILPSILIGFYVPSILLSTSYLTRDQHQIVSAIWQCFPLWVSILQIAFSYVAPKSDSPYTSRRQTLYNFLPFLIFFHYYSLYKIYQLSIKNQTNLISTLTSIYFIPISQSTYPGTAHLFLLFDYLMVFISAGLLVCKAPGKARYSIRNFITSFLLFGPGSIVVIYWRRREEEMREGDKIQKGY